MSLIWLRPSLWWEETRLSPGETHDHPQVTGGPPQRMRKPAWALVGDFLVIDLQDSIIPKWLSNSVIYYISENILWSQPAIDQLALGYGDICQTREKHWIFFLFTHGVRKVLKISISRRPFGSWKHWYYLFTHIWMFYVVNNYPTYF